MQRINVTVSDEAKDNLLAYQKRGKFARQDDALDEILLSLDDPGETSRF